jgi:transposase InsO family protein
VECRPTINRPKIRSRQPDILNRARINALPPRRNPRYGLRTPWRYMTRTVPLRIISAFTVARAFCEQWVFVYGAPRYFLTYNGTQFTAKFFLAVCRELGIGKVFTAAYHPQTNGQVERFNRTIVNSLRGYVSQYQNKWYEFPSAITFGYNCRIHSSFGLAPFELVLSRPPPPLSAEHPESGKELSLATEKLRFLLRLKDVRDLAKTRLTEAQARY